jgi:plasmid stability protein
MNITLKNVPERLHARLKEAASQNGRSINTEAIATLESQYLPRKLTALEHLQSIHETQARYPIRRHLSNRELKEAITSGRE